MTPLFEEKEMSKTRTTKEKNKKLKNPKFSAFFGTNTKMSADVAQRAASHEFQNLLSGVVISPKNKSVIVIFVLFLNTRETLITRARLISLSLPLRE